MPDIIGYSTKAYGNFSSVGKVALWVDGRTFSCANPASGCVVATIQGQDQPHSVGDPFRVVFTDMDGNGTEDFVLLGRAGMWHFSFLGVAAVPAVGRRSPRPGPLTRINNGLGAQTEIVYETIQKLMRGATDPDPVLTSLQNRGEVSAPVGRRSRTTSALSAVTSSACSWRSPS